MYDNQEVNKKKYYLSENHDSHICLESGKCEYVDDKGNFVTETYGINNYWYMFLAYLIKHNGIKISFEQLYEYVYGFNPYDLVSDDKENDNDDPIKRCRNQLNDFYMKIHTPKKRDKVKFYKYVKNKGFSLVKDGDTYCVELPKQSSDVDIIEEKIRLDERYKSITTVSGNNYCERKSIEKQIEKQFANNRFVFISGLSGTGKSEVARAYGMHNSNYTYILPLKLNEDGSGDLKSLIKQLKNSSGKEITTATLITTIKDEKVLIILDNYNSESEIIFEIREVFCDCDVLVTSQISTDMMRTFGPIIQMGDNCIQDSEWVEEIFVKYAGLSTISENDRKCISEIAKIVGCHTMLLCQIALQHKRSGEGLEDILSSIRKGISSYLRTNSDIKTSMLKDGHFLNKISPYELLKILFANNIMARSFSDIERQVLGAIIHTENFINNIEFVCELVGDNNALGCKKARNAMVDLQEDHIVEIYNDSVSLHPLIKSLVTDDSIFNDKHTIADIAYEFLVHILCNKLVEEVTIHNYEVSNYVWGRKYPTYFSWVLDFVHSTIIPHMIQEEELPVDFGSEYTYFIISAQNDRGGKALYLSFDKDVICLLNAGEQLEKRYRYYSHDNYFAGENNACNGGVIIECNCSNKESILSIPGEVGDINITSIGRYVFESKKIPRNVFIGEGIEEIRDYCFLNATGMQTINLPNSLSYIGLRSFEFCDDLQTVNWGSGLKKLKQSSFANCKNLKGTLKLPNGIDEIQRYSFMNTGIEELILPNYLNDIGRSCFYDCVALKKVTFGEKFSEIRYQMLFGCDALERVVIPGNIKIIHEEAFGRCISLKEVIIEEGVERINNCAFIHCTELLDVWFPKSVVSIAKGIFAECPKVVAHVFEGSSAAKQLERYRVELGKMIQIEYM